MNREKKTELKSQDLAQVTGGTPPELPATNLSGSGYEGMLPPCGLDPISEPSLEATPVVLDDLELLP